MSRRSAPTTAAPTNAITTSAEKLAERLVLGALIDGVTAGVSAVVGDSGKVEIVIAAVVSDRGFLFLNRDVLTEHEGTITHADGSADGWELRVLFPDKASLSEAHNAAQEAGFRFDVTVIYGTEDSRSIQYGLSETQRDTLVAAFEQDISRSRER